MKFRKTITLTLKEKQQIFKLWNNEYPREFIYENLEQFEVYLEGLKDQNHILVLDEKKNIIGWYFDFIRESERWFALILDSKFHGNKIGTSLMEKAKKDRNRLNGWVIKSSDYLKANGAAYRSPVDFYRKNEFLLDNDTFLEAGKVTAIKMSWEKNM